MEKNKEPRTNEEPQTPPTPHCFFFFTRYFREGQKYEIIPNKVVIYESRAGRFHELTASINDSIRVAQLDGCTFLIHFKVLGVLINRFNLRLRALSGFIACFINQIP